MSKYIIPRAPEPEFEDLLKILETPDFDVYLPDWEWQDDITETPDSPDSQDLEIPHNIILGVN